MTSYTTIPDTDIDADSPLTVSLLTLIRDNPIAITEGATGAPKVQTAGITDYAVTTVKLATGEQMTTSNVNGAIAGSSVGAIGTYAFLLETVSGGTYIPGATLSGSSLVYAGTQNTNAVTDGSVQACAYATGPSGTWRCMGYADYTSTGGNHYGTTLWLRIS